MFLQAPLEGGLSVQPQLFWEVISCGDSSYCLVNSPSCFPLGLNGAWFRDEASLGSLHAYRVSATGLEAHRRPGHLQTRKTLGSSRLDLPWHGGATGPAGARANLGSQAQGLPVEEETEVCTVREGNDTTCFRPFRGIQLYRNIFILI